MRRDDGGMHRWTCQCHQAKYRSSGRLTLILRCLGLGTRSLIDWQGAERGPPGLTMAALLWGSNGLNGTVAALRSNPTARLRR